MVYQIEGWELEVEAQFVLVRKDVVVAHGQDAERMLISG